MSLSFTLFLLGLASASAHTLYPRQQGSILSIPQSAWQALNTSVDGRLLASRPAGLPCYTEYQNQTGSYANPSNLAKCAVAEQGVNQSDYIVSQVGAYFNPEFATCMSKGQGCPVNSTLVDPTIPISGTCYQGSVPNYAINVGGVADVQKGLAFANKYKIPLVVKNTGHDYKGRSASPLSLGLWTHNVQPPITLNKNFIPDGCSASAGPALTYGAGQGLMGIYNFANANGYTFAGGLCPTVGASGGYIAGGGYGALTPTLGLAVDNVLQIRVVLPNGTYVTANRCQHQDLFFALRGGGGNTFGVMMETTSRVFPEFPLTFAYISMTPPNAVNITSIFVQNAIRWAQERWGGYVGDGAGADGATAFIGLNPNLTIAEATASLQPVIDYANSVSTAEHPSSVVITTVPNYYSFQISPIVAAFSDPSIGLAIAQASRLIPINNFQGTANQNALVNALAAEPYGAFMVPPYYHELPASDQPGGLGYASVTPAWRNSIWHVVRQNLWDAAIPSQNTPAAVANEFRTISDSMTKLRSLTPNGGAYLNEGDTFEPDPIDSFWGQANYNRLLALKRRLDPNNIMSCLRCVGYNPQDARFQCYPQI